MTSQRSGTPSMELSDVQKADLARVWSNHSFEPDDAFLSNSSVYQEEILDDVTYHNIARLHSFLLNTVSELSSKAVTVNEAEANTNALDYLLMGIFCGVKRNGNASEKKFSLTERRQVVLLPYQLFHDSLRTFEEKQGRYLQPPYASFLYHFPEKALSALGCAMALCMATLWRRNTVSSINNTELMQYLVKVLEKCQFVVRFSDADRMTSFADIKTSLNSKFVAVKGYVVKAKPKRLRVIKAEFRCNRCGEQFPFKLISGKYNIPSRCVASNCRSKTFVIVRSTAKYVGFQELKLQELAEEIVANANSSSSDAGRSPRQIEVHVTEDLVDACATGDIIKVVGIVKSISTALAAGRTGRQALETSTYKLYIKANSIINTTSSESNSSKGLVNDKKRRSSSATVVFSAPQLDSIRKIAHADHRIGTMKMRQSFPFDLLVHSLCPSIVGHELVKAGLLLTLLGGTPSPVSGLESHFGSGIRSNSHILIVG